MAVFPFLLACAGTGGEEPAAWRMVVAVAAALCCLGASFCFFRKKMLGKMLACFAVCGCGVAGLPFFLEDPRIALLAGVSLIQAAFTTIDYRLRRQQGFLNQPESRSLQRARGALWSVVMIAVSPLILDTQRRVTGEMAIAIALLLSQVMIAHWIWRNRKEGWSVLLLAMPCLFVGAGYLTLVNGLVGPTAAVTSLAALAILPRVQRPLAIGEEWWEPLLNHPARILISTFLGLCLLGTIVLQIPWASARGNIAPIDAAFTSVSAVCVTGLTVLDTPNDFSLLGQALILLLIQLGGFGIMTISTVALHAMGKRLSLRQERLMTTLTETSHSELIDSLLLIVRFTLLVELAGTVILAANFFNVGDSWAQALWRGLFTAVSAFCNAGFALQSDNLIPYRSEPLILHTVAALIVFGGLAPAASLMLPQWLRGRTVPVGPRIAMITTAVLLLSGTILYLVFEWGGSLAGLSPAEKLHNAWFQSVTLRTAGFNSVDIGGVIGPTYLVMLCLMFIGGSPGGTAGGIKTTTVGVLALTFWASVIGRNNLIVQNRRIPQSAINRAVTVTVSGLLVWLLALMALEITQQIPSRALAFEVTSALGTVGLSIGATPHLDEIGKIIIILTMFLGRVGPMTLFTLLSWETARTDAQYPDASITLN
jgi:trk system potassium uptake protein